MYTAEQRAVVADLLAGTILSARWTSEAIAEACAVALAHWPSWLDALALHVLAAHRNEPTVRREVLAATIWQFLAQRRAGSELVQIDVPAVRGETAPPRFRWPVARVQSTPDLAAALELSDGQLAWLSDVRGLERTAASEQLRNYRYAAVARRSGLPRVIEAPKLRLKEVQRWILREILEHVPVHEAAQGFARRRSVLDHAARHSAQRAVLSLDLADFFASVSAGRVFGIFRTAGYPAPVAHVLTGLTTNTVPLHVWRVVHDAAGSAGIGPRFELGRRLATPHLPQGAPSSPALANLAAFRLDRRLSGLAAGHGLRYSRYADDLTFSGAGLRQSAPWLQTRVAEVVADEGFALNEAKTTLRTAAARQTVCGIVVNVSPNVSRTEYDRLKAILHNAARDGPASQGVADLEGHLRGRIAWVASLNPRRGAKLLRRFEQINWS